MAGKFCVLRAGFSEQEALACEPGKRLSHRHLSRRQAKELLVAGDIVEFDLHPATLLPRFVWKRWDRARPLPGAPVILRNAGAAENHEVQRARRLLSDIASSSLPLSSVIAAERIVQLPVKIQGSTLFYRGDGGTSIQGKPILVKFGGRSPELMEIAREYLGWMRRSSRQRRELPYVYVDMKSMKV